MMDTALKYKECYPYVHREGSLNTHTSAHIQVCVLSHTPRQSAAQIND